MKNENGESESNEKTAREKGFQAVPRYRKTKLARYKFW